MRKWSQTILDSVLIDLTAQLILRTETKDKYHVETEKLEMLCLKYTEYHKKTMTLYCV